MVPDERLEWFRHMDWADAVVWQAVLAEPSARKDPSTRVRLHHIHQVQWAFLQIWREEALDLPEISDFEELPQIRAWGWKYHQQVRDYLQGSDVRPLDEPIELPWQDQLVERFGKARSASFRQTLMQVAFHSTYHRGQVNARLRELGGEPPLTDFIAWIWMDEPAPDWGD